MTKGKAWRRGEKRRGTRRILLAGSVRPVVERLEDRRLLAITFDPLPDRTIEEGQSLDFDGYFANSLSANPHRMKFEWGQSGAGPTTWDQAWPDPNDGNRAWFWGSRLYPAGGDFTVRVTATNESDATDTATTSFTAHVLKVAPTVRVGSATPKVTVGDTYTLALQYSDPGGVNVSALEIDWGAGEADRYQTVAGHPSSVAHVFSSPGLKTIAVTPVDGDFPTGLPAVHLSYDAGFGAGAEAGTGTGSVVADVGSASWDDVGAVARSASGKLLVAGDGDGKLAVLSYNDDGSADATFGNQSPANGRALLTFGTGPLGDAYVPHAAAMAVGAAGGGADGKIYVAGDVRALRTPSSAGYDFALARLNADGTLDATFGSGGVVVTPFAGGADARANAIAIDPDTGAITLAGFAGSDLAVARYTPAGALDTTFGTGGKLTVDLGGYADIAYAVKIDPAGRIVVAGRKNDDMAVARLLDDGSADTLFGSAHDGKAVFDVGAGDFAYDLDFDAQGGDDAIVVGGEADGERALARLTDGGTLDTNFGTGGVVTGGPGALPGGYWWRVSAGADGSVLAGGSVYTDPGLLHMQLLLARYDAAGSLDPTFGEGGAVLSEVTPSTIESLSVLGVFADADGKITAAGWTVDPGFFDICVQRFLPGNAVSVVPPAPAAPASLNAVGIAADQVALAWLALPVPGPGRQRRRRVGRRGFADRRRHDHR